jgi:diguanylate cyclase (GGDEF)-like protein
MRDVSQRILFEENLKSLSLTDSLTKLGNRRAFDQTIEREWRRALRDDTPLSLLLLDLDNFKGFNDRYGHQAGDDCLRVIATAVAAVVRRAGDGAFRYGGEEIAVILPATDEFRATLIAEQLRGSIEAARIPRTENGGPRRHVTASIGVATAIPRLGDKANVPAGLFQAADGALYRAKENGRNRVETAAADGPRLVSSPFPEAGPQGSARQGEAEPIPMPEPTYWPMALALGITLSVAGLVTSGEKRMLISAVTS